MSYQLIATGEMSGTVFTISNIPQNFRSLELIASPRSNSSSSDPQSNVYFNSDTAGTYDALGFRNYASNLNTISGSGAFAYSWNIAGASAFRSIGWLRINLSGYSINGANKVARITSGLTPNTSNSGMHVEVSLRYSSTSPITAINLDTTASDSVQGTYWLYGIG